MDPLLALRRIAFLLERRLAREYRVKAFRTAAAVVASQGPADIARRADNGTLKELRGIGDATAQVIEQALAGHTPAYLAQLEAEAGELVELDEPSQALRASLRGDLHSHSDWSDGGSPIEEMVVTASELGHEYLALTDHSPRLTVAHGLSAQRLSQQLDVVADINARLSDIRLLAGIEVDILEDGSLDQTPELLERLDIVVASVHSRLGMDAAAMTDRMVAAVRNPHTNILGHCTGRLLGPKRRSESDFDAAAVFRACAEHAVAVEINCRPERLDPPRRLLDMAVDAECLFSIDTDGHAPGQLDWQVYGCARATERGVPPERVVNTWPAERLLEWSAGGR